LNGGWPNVLDHAHVVGDEQVGEPQLTLENTARGRPIAQGRLSGLLAVLVIVSAGCGDVTATSAPPAVSGPETPTAAETVGPNASSLVLDQVLRIGIRGEPSTLDPTRAHDPVSISVVRALTRPLVYFDQDLKIVPELASSYDWSPDARTITFHLRDAKYSDGDPIIAGDLVYSWRRLVDPRASAPDSFVMADVVGASGLLALAGADPLPNDADIDALLHKLGVSAPDDRTFIVQLNTPATYFLAIAAMWVLAPVQQKWITSPNPTEAGNYVSSGPYILDTWQHDDRIVLKPNPNWYGDTKSTLTEIDISVRSDPAAAQAAYEAGQADMVLTPNAAIPRVQADPILGSELLVVPTPAVRYYDFNNFEDPQRSSFANAGPTANKDFRIALTEAVDKQAFIDAEFAGIGDVASSIVMPGIPGYQPELNPYRYNLAAARQSMTKALTALGKSSAADLGTLRIGVSADAGQEAAFLADAWRTAFGLETDVIHDDSGTFLTKRADGQYDIAEDGWAAVYPQANDQLNGRFTCHDKYNDNQYCNKDFDALITQASAEPDQDKQVALYNLAQTLMIDDAPVLPLRFQTQAYEVKPYVAGLLPTSADAQMPGDLFYESIRMSQP
jgi:oligopeptide transport system substrate-binding protein